MQTVSFVFPDFSTNISVYAPEFSRPTEHSLRAMFFTALTYFDILLTLYTYGIFLTLLCNLRIMLSRKMIEMFHQTPPSNVWNVLTQKSFRSVYIDIIFNLLCNWYIFFKKSNKFTWLVNQMFTTYKNITITERSSRMNMHWNLYR